MTIDQMLSDAAESLHSYRDAIVGPDLDERVTRRRQASPTQRNLAISLGAAAALALVIGLTALLAPLGDDEAPFVEEVAPTTVPVTSVTSPPENTTPPTPTTAAAVPAEPVPSITWTRMELAATSAEAALDTIAAAEDGFLAGGFDGRDAAIWRSDDGSAWERATITPAGEESGDSSDGTFAEVVGFASLGERTVAVGFEGTGAAGDMYFAGLDRWNSSAWLDASPVAVVWSSGDGAIWTRVPHDGAVFGGDDVVLRMWAVAASPDQFVAVGDAVWRSADGLTWERSPSPGGTLFSIIFDGTQFVAAGLDPSGREGMYRSIDGIEWVDMPVEQGDGWWRPAPLLDVANVGYAYLAVGQLGVWRAVDVSVEAEKIYQVDTNIGSYLSGIAVDGDLAVAVGEKNQGFVSTSSDGGQTWTKEKNQDVFGMRYLEDESGAIRDVALVEGRIVAVGRVGFGAPAVWIGEWTD
ncbi:MAG: hypothetical protein P1T08_12270 [Acidimicrobiia bacterium]|nr:hypothetical protein [Acidimicrobiia bacterium]